MEERYCVDCKHMRLQRGLKLCEKTAKVLDVVTGEKYLKTCVAARREECGEEGKLWEKK